MLGHDLMDTGNWKEEGLIMTPQIADRHMELEKGHFEYPEVLTLLDLVNAVCEATSDEDEVVSTVKRLINSGKVTLVGNFRGADVRVG